MLWHSVACRSQPLGYRATRTCISPNHSSYYMGVQIPHRMDTFSSPLKSTRTLRRRCYPLSEYFTHLLLLGCTAQKDAAYCYICSVVGVSVCLLVTTMSCAKTAEPIQMPFGLRLRWAQGTLFLVGAGIPKGRGNLGHLPVRCEV